VGGVPYLPLEKCTTRLPTSCARVIRRVHLHTSDALLPLSLSLSPPVGPARDTRARKQRRIREKSRQQLLRDSYKYIIAKWIRERAPLNCWPLLIATFQQVCCLQPRATLYVSAYQRTNSRHYLPFPPYRPRLRSSSWSS